MHVRVALTPYPVRSSLWATLTNLPTVSHAGCPCEGAHAIAELSARVADAWADESAIHGRPLELEREARRAVREWRGALEHLATVCECES